MRTSYVRQWLSYLEVIYILVNHKFKLYLIIFRLLPFVRSNSILKHRRTKWTKNERLMVVLAKYITLKKIKI